MLTVQKVEILALTKSYGAMSNSEEISKISNPIIRGKRPIYFFISDSELKNFKNDSIIGDITFALFSIALGTSISEKDWAYSLFGFAFLCISVYFYTRTHRSISSVSSSGEIESFEVKTTQGEGDQFQIVKATYGTPPSKILDKTELLNSKIQNGKLVFHVDNSNLECQGDKDPDKGVNKVLDITYQAGNNIIKRHYTEYSDVVLP